MKNRPTILIVGLLVAVLCLVGVGQTKMRGTIYTIAEIDLQYHIRSADEAEMMLLDTSGISNDRQWRKNFSGQVLGFGIRSERKTLEDADLARVKELLLDEASYFDGGNTCLVAGDAALLMRSPIGEVLIMFELWCNRIHIRVETRLSGAFRGYISPITPELRELVHKYFEDDEYFINQIEKAKR